MMLQKQFEVIIELINDVRSKAIQQVNSSMIELYFEIGKHIATEVRSENWGKGVVKELAIYIQQNHPKLKGFSDKNLWRMKQFYESYENHNDLMPLVKRLSWTHNLIIISRTKKLEEKIFYLKLSINEKYSTRELDRQINSSVFERIMIGNQKLSALLREIHPDINNTFKDEYIFEFLNLPTSHLEKDLQKALKIQMKDFILELGKDFIFIDEEYRVQVGNSDFYIDLLFYHRGLQCLVAFELKTDKFKPEYLGQLNFYLEALDKDIKKDNENPSIGVLLCKDKDNEVVEYALNRNLSPTLISEYKMQLPNKEMLMNKLHDIFR